MSVASPIASALERFLAFKQAAGCRYQNEAYALSRLDRFLVQHLAPVDPIISLEVVRAYVARSGHESESSRAARLSLIRQVCRFLALEDPRTAVPGPRFLGIHRRPFVPRVLTREEGRRFLDTCTTFASPHRSPLCNTILGTALGLLYLTGLRAGEALHLTEASPDLFPSRLTWRVACVTTTVRSHLVSVHARLRRHSFRPLLVAATPTARCARPSMPYSRPPASRGTVVVDRCACTIHGTRSLCCAS